MAVYEKTLLLLMFQSRFGLLLVLLVWEWNSSRCLGELEAGLVLEAELLLGAELVWGAAFLWEAELLLEA